jgi:uncharacterized protein (DUF2236 family)
MHAPAFWPIIGVHPAAAIRSDFRVTNAIQNALGTRFRRIITDSPDGMPPWLEQVADGDDAGLFSPTDAPWVVHGDLATLIGGIRALLVQALHPGSLAGVSQHSRYEQDPLGRLAGTTKWLTITTFGSCSAIEAEASRVNRMHARVQGEYTDNSGQVQAYRAADQDLLLWVHVAFTDSFLATHQMYGSKPIPGGADSYVRLWAKSVAPLGLDEVPLSSTELEVLIAGLIEDHTLSVTPMTKKVIRFIQKPPLSRTARAVYLLLFQAALVTLPPSMQALVGLKSWPKWIVVPMTRALLRTMRLAIGSHSPLEDAALSRLARIGVTA